ncbi:hypothetical protein D3C71_1670280 [compost metagenome]
MQRSLKQKQCGMREFKRQTLKSKGKKQNCCGIRISPKPPRKTSLRWLRLNGIRIQRKRKPTRLIIFKRHVQSRPLLKNR